MTKWGITIATTLIAFSWTGSDVAFSAPTNQRAECLTTGTSSGPGICEADAWSADARQIAGTGPSSHTHAEDPAQLATGPRAGKLSQDICLGSPCTDGNDRRRFAEIKPTTTPAAATQSSPTESVLTTLVGSYGIVSAGGKTASCEKNAFALSFNGDQLTFTERNGKVHVERIISFDSIEVSTQVVSSANDQSGTLYKYRRLDGGSLGVRNLKTGNSFTLAPCAAPPTSPMADQTAQLARPQPDTKEREQQAAKQDAQKQSQTNERKNQSGASASAATQCDILAASSMDKGRMAPGVEASKIAVPAAISSCREAVANDPDNPRLLYQLGRALDAANMLQDAVQFYKKSAERGFSLAQDELGTMHFTGRGVIKNDIEAVRLFKLSADQGFPSAQNNLGFMYQEGRGVARDDKEAARLYKMASDQGYAAAQNNLGLLYQEARGVPENLKEAARLYKLAADQGVVSALNNLGTMYLIGKGVDQNDLEALRLYKIAAEQKNPSAQNNLGVMYQTGRGVAQSDAEAARFYRMAADQGFASAQKNLGAMYHYGKGVEQSYGDAMRLYKSAAEQGQTSAQAALCHLHRQGTGAGQNFKEAFRFCQISSEKGNVSAILSLAEMYEIGEGVDQNYTEALRLYKIAAGKGDSYAQFYVGYMLDNGIGIQKNKSEAAVWYKLSADNGNKDAAKKIEMMNKSDASQNP